MKGQRSMRPGKSALYAMCWFEMLNNGFFLLKILSTSFKIIGEDLNEYNSFCSDSLSSAPFNLSEK